MINAMKANRQACVEYASTAIADVGDVIETDMIHADSEDDLMSIISHLEILERNARNLRDMLKATLEGQPL